jgi:iron uptake system EfeUOB component EfeO/EfeM
VGRLHKVEQALWVRNTTAGMAPVARKLLSDVTDLRAKVRTVELDAAQIANGANELLGEVSKSKITGEEERYSRIDLVDFKANLEGARAAFDGCAQRSTSATPSSAPLPEPLRGRRPVAGAVSSGNRLPPLQSPD